MWVGGKISMCLLLLSIFVHACINDRIQKIGWVLKAFTQAVMVSDFLSLALHDHFWTELLDSNPVHGVLLGHLSPRFFVLKIQNRGACLIQCNPLFLHSARSSTTLVNLSSCLDHDTGSVLTILVISLWTVSKLILEHFISGGLVEVVMLEFMVLVCSMQLFSPLARSLCPHHDVSCSLVQ